MQHWNCDVQLCEIVIFLHHFNIELYLYLYLYLCTPLVLSGSYTFMFVLLSHLYFI